MTDTKNDITASSAASTGASENDVSGTAPEDDCDSDVEMEGMDMDEDDEQLEDDDAVEEDTNVVGTKHDDVPDSKTQEEEEKEQQELEEARKERMDLMAAELKKQTGVKGGDLSKGKEAGAAGDGDGNGGEGLDSKFQYLIGQSEVFAHFLAGSIATEQKSKKKGSRGKANRLTEAEEDAQLLKTAQSGRRTVYLNQQPSILADHCKMHKYQLEGLNWMIKLHDHGINGILADEMGLGKTLQTISLLAYLREARGVKGPHIVIVPKSVVGNWCKEFRKWCPSIRAIRMGGTKEERQKCVSNELRPDPTTGKYKFDALVCSYEAVLKEKSVLGKILWRYLIIDEAHRIKNENSSLSKAVRLLNTGFRLLITGTPLQNNLHELWALLNFLLPEIFGDSEQFDEWFSMSGKEGQENVIRKLHTVLRPFMLRRVKKDVACALPPKKETKLFIGLTEMQQDWYKRVLRKDAHELNALGGPSHARLQNVLMHLRKVCNHPYLFDGAEQGPPFSDGPHLWENCAKMQLLNKLLPKLKAKGSRVLIFCQMTRVLDIMEDYFRLVGYDYCRIDGSTSGESRDSQMEEFNAPNSPKFCFLLSTRAGGLGINLATADIVILYDSDWNPQVDLQAMDRAHRIGQKKPVQVFRFVTEGTVEEKIIERADRKLFLDAAVIQQGRLAEQNSKLSKDELMQMVRFGADQIISGKRGAYTDEDIDALIAKGEKKTMDMQAKLQTNAQHNLASFTLSGDLDKDGKDTFLFGGENYRDKNKDSNSLFIDIGTRERKRTVYDVNEYFREAMNSGTSSGMKGHAADAAARKKRKGPHMQDFQLYNRERIEELSARERELAQFKEDHLSIMNELRRRAATAGPAEKENLKEEIGEMEVMLNQFILSPEEQAEKERLLSEGFADWSRKDFKSFCNALEKHGRYQLPKIIEDVVQETGKDEGDIKRYYVAFWLHYCRLADWNKIIDKIEKGERKIHRLREIRDIIQEKIERHLESVYGTIYPDINNEVVSDSTKELLKQHSPWDLLQYSWSTMQFKYGSGQKTWSYRQEEDAFLMMMMHRHGYGAARRIQLEIRRAWQFRFNWFFKSRSPQEIQKRCDLLIKNVEKELEECHEKEAQEAAEELERKEAELKRMNQELEQSKEAVFGAGVMSTIETNSEQALQSSN
mmetsp:Transcript_13792/g.29113  ORF Transcript_13792/g.29113 Transcript_13792/m.29113 type:complete len:1161 (-) Transcript_13792:1566-5048(-)|eukprot:CAMPEP_0171332954 /NCGR_PEP_ID=MMETSP0878-20121228/3704_1 /TAXON_ID=67004 /ORGANISM="Thalassiosira weissflogii, Strain CCMP1336" /LENGTH=1160 /DNA_ID=CAMNT_0011833811 /DNA_START=32 /DNA_END=3514 /DNA_ORIENTATION=-